MIQFKWGEVNVVVGGDPVMAAAETYNARQRYSHNVPYNYDNGTDPYMTKHSYYFVTEAKFDCCKDIFASFTAHLSHCRSAVHIATMFGVDRVEVLRTARQLRILEALNG